MRSTAIRVAQSERQAAFEQEFKSAQELQQVLIPESLPSLEGYAVTSAYRPAQQVGGDFFQLIAEPDGSALLIMGDVSGKGLKAAMTVSLIVGAIRTAADTLDDPAEILAILNRRLYGRLQNGLCHLPGNAAGCGGRMRSWPMPGILRRFSIRMNSTCRELFR